MKSLKVAGILVLIAVGIFFITQNTDPRKELGAEKVEAKAEGTKSAEPAISGAPAVAKVVSITAAERLQRFVEVQNSLADFAKINIKTVRSAEETRKLEELFQSENVYQKIYAFLSIPPLEVTTQLEKVQNISLDFLELALKATPNTLAENTVRKLVSESQLENPELPFAVRDNLAEVQSELLLMITQNLAVNEARQINRGPASQKILDNIQQLYDDNSALSKEAK